MVLCHRIIALAVVMALAGSAEAQVQSPTGGPLNRELTTVLTQQECLRRAEFALRSAGITEHFQFYPDSVRAITNDFTAFVGWIRYIPAMTLGDYHIPARIMISVVVGTNGPHYPTEDDKVRAQKMLDTLISYLSQ